MFVCDQWRVASSVLHILHKLLDGYEMTHDDFIDRKVEVPGEGERSAYKPPGHSLMLHMLNDTPMLKMVRCRPPHNRLTFTSTVSSRTACCAQLTYMYSGLCVCEIIHVCTCKVKNTAVIW